MIRRRSSLTKDALSTSVVETSFETGRRMLPVEQELDAICHLLRGEDLGNQHRASNEQTDGIGWREQDAGVRHSSGVQAQMIGIGGDQDPGVCFRKHEQRGV